MVRFVIAHRLDYRTAADVFLRQLGKVGSQVADHLSLGLFDKPETPTITSSGHQHSYYQRPCKPEKIQSACGTVEVAQPLLTPEQVIALLPRSLHQGARDSVVPCQCCLPHIQGLRAYFPSVVNTHQAGRFAALACGQRGVWNTVRGRAPLLKPIGRSGGAQNIVDATNEPIQGRQLTHRSAPPRAAARQQKNALNHWLPH